MLRKIHSAYYSTKNSLKDWKQSVWPSVAPEMSPEEKGRFVDAAIAKLALHNKRLESIHTTKNRLIIGCFIVSSIFAAHRANFFDKFFGSSKYDAIIAISGEIAADSSASATNIVPAIQSAFQSNRVRSVLLKINSGGGSPVEAEKIVDALHIYKEKYKKPVYAFIEESGASAAYMIAAEADTIYSAKYSIVGSIGAVLNSWQFKEALDKVAIKQKSYTSGELKGMLNPFTEGSPQVDSRINSLVSDLAENFYQEIKEKRGGKLKNDVVYNNGNVWTGPEAKKLGLIDDIKTIPQYVSENNNLETRIAQSGVEESGIEVTAKNILTASFKDALKPIFGTQLTVR